MFKNVASQKIDLFAFDATTGLPKTGDAANLTAYVAKDDGAVTALTDTSAAERDATKAPGWYSFDVSQAETNGDKLLFTGKSATSNIVVVGAVIYTLPVGFTALVSGNLDAAITSRAAASTALSNATWTDTRAGKLDNLDAAVTTRAAASTALSNATWTDVKAGYLDAAVTTRSTLTAANVWEYATRTVTSYGTLVADTATAVWAAGTRTLTSFGTLVSDIWTAVTRTLTSGAAPSVGDIDAQLSATHGAGAWGGAAGSGSEEMVYTLTLADLTTPIADALVVVTTNSSGTGVVASGRTDAAGEVTFYLDVGTYYLWRFKTGYNFTNPDAETVI